MVWLVCGYFGWFVGDLACLWVVSSFTANGAVIGNFKKGELLKLFSSRQVPVMHKILNEHPKDDNNVFNTGKFLVFYSYC